MGLDVPDGRDQEKNGSGDIPGLEQLLERHLSWIQTYVHRKLSDLIRRKAETGDIVQDAVVQFLRHGPRFRLSNDRQFRALLARIVENVLRDKYDWFTAHRRAIARERPLPADTVLDLDPAEGMVDSPSQIVQRHEQEAWVRLGLELLDPGERRIIVFRDWEDLSFTEIGKRTGMTKGTARRRYLDSIEQLITKVRALKSGDLNAVLGDAVE
jgi:RNA polymerase sigma factor (sigma-70 family)